MGKYLLIQNDARSSFFPFCCFAAAARAARIQFYYYNVFLLLYHIPTVVSSLKYIHIYAKFSSSILNDVNDDFFVVVVVAVYVFVTRSRVFTETVVDDFKKVLAFS